MGILSNEPKQRVIQEYVPGKQITLAHVIASPNRGIYMKLGLDDGVSDALGILTITPSEGVIIAADIAIKSSAAELGFVDRFSGTLILTGTVSAVEASFEAIATYVRDKLGFTVCNVTRT